MTFSSKMFWFAEKIGLFSNVGSVAYPLVSLLVFVPTIFSQVNLISKFTFIFYLLLEKHELTCQKS